VTEERGDGGPERRGKAPPEGRRGSRPAAGRSALRARRAGSFGGAATAYADHRPDYPDPAVRWALEPVRDRGAGPAGPRVLDLAAGTGKLTGVLVRHRLDVVAVEPDPQMLAELRRRVPGARALAGTAERIPLPAGAVDAVLVGQAFHWFDPVRALPEIARVLTPGGVLAALWNGDDDRVEWVAGLGAAARTSASFPPRDRQRPLPASALFQPPERAEFAHVLRRTTDSMIATLGTHSHVLVLDAGERAAWERRVRAYLRSRPETSSGEFDLPLLVEVARALRA
jgi:SAM-dependent methyltransferase